MHAASMVFACRDLRHFILNLRTREAHLRLMNAYRMFGRW